MRELAVWVLCISGVCFSLCLLFSGVALIAGSGVRAWILWGVLLFILGGVDSMRCGICPLGGLR